MPTPRAIPVALACALLALSACWKNDTVQVGDDTGTGEVLETQKVTVLMNNGKAITDPVHGKEQGFWYGAVLGAGGINANGVAYLYAFEDGSYVSTVNLNIATLPKGKYYVGWATKADGSDPVRMGWMASLFGDVRHSLRLETKDVLSDRLRILVTEESTQNPTEPGKAVAEGTLKRHAREP